MKPTYRKSWPGNLLIWSGLALGPSCKVKRWFMALLSGLSRGYDLHLIYDELGIVY